MENMQTIASESCGYHVVQDLVSRRTVFEMNIGERVTKADHVV